MKSYFCNLHHPQETIPNAKNDMIFYGAYGLEADPMNLLKVIIDLLTWLRNLFFF